MKDYINQLLLAAIMGIVSLGVTYIKDLSKEVQNISVAMVESRAEHNLKFNQLGELIRDHEGRLREIERQKQRSK